MDIPFCRLCQNPLPSVAGCDVCSPAKKHLVWPQLDNEDQSVEELAQETARALKYQLRLLRKVQTKQKGYDHTVTQNLCTLNNSLTKLITELRKLELDHAARAQTMTHADRAKAVGEWFEGLPQEAQLEFLQTITRLYNEGSMQVLHVG